MEAYIFQAALLCEDCAHAVIQQMQDQGTWDGSRDDSDFRPIGPYANGGGKADCPQHCDNADCRCFLENPLTDNGRQYVRQLIAEHITTGSGSRDVLLEWAEYYFDTMGDLLQPSCGRLPFCANVRKDTP